MKRALVNSSIFALTLFVAAIALKAEVRTEEKSQLKLEGLSGRMMGMFAGKAAGEGIINTVAIKGDRRMKLNDLTGEIVDLSEEKIYNLDMKKKTYEIITFEEMRRRLKEAQKQAAREGAGEAQPDELTMEFDVSLKESGQRRSINGYDCREVIMTITGRQKGKTLEEAGGMVMTSRIWLGPNIPALKEIEEFEQRYARALGDVFSLGDSAEQMAMAMAMYPGMKDMIGKMQIESVNMDGARILTEMTLESVASPAQMSREQKQESEPDSGITSVKGLGGLLGRRIARRKAADGEADKQANRSKILTLNHELLKVSTDVSASDVTLPAGFKEKK